MSISNSDYSKMTDKASPNSPTVLNCVKAFLIGGAICTFDISQRFSYNANTVSTVYWERSFQ